VRSYDVDKSERMKIDRFDHLVLTVATISLTCEFFTKVLGRKVIEYEQD
jgi:catechol 2,3-dioxygenase-like lactoylglutathione lyase family enzyme